MKDRELTWLQILKIFFLITDIGFIVYWVITAFHLIPNEFLFQNYNDPKLVQWNWSFVFVDLAISASGLTTLWLEKRKNKNWQKFALISLVLTFSSGLMAIGYWVIGMEFDVQWWIPNLYLLVYPIPFAYYLLQKES